MGLPHSTHTWASSRLSFSSLIPTPVSCPVLHSLVVCHVSPDSSFTRLFRLTLGAELTLTIRARTTLIYQIINELGEGLLKQTSSIANADLPLIHLEPSGQMARSWGRTLGNVRSFIGNSMGGLRGGSNLASWVVAGTLAYFLWVKPSQDLKKEQEARAALAASDPHRYVEKRKPIPDPQETGLIYGNKNRTNKPSE